MVNLLLDPASKQCTNMAMVNKAKRSEKRACINRVILFKMLFKVARTWDQQHDIHLSFSKNLRKIGKVALTGIESMGGRMFRLISQWAQSKAVHFLFNVLHGKAKSKRRMHSCVFNRCSRTF